MKEAGGGTIRVCADVKDGCLVVQVADDGCGMTPEKLEEVQREVAGDLGQISEGGLGCPISKSAFSWPMERITAFT